MFEAFSTTRGLVFFAICISIFTLLIRVFLALSDYLFYQVQPEVPIFELLTIRHIPQNSIDVGFKVKVILSMVPTI